MSMLHTIQNTYVPMRVSDVTVDDTVLDSSTAGFTFAPDDKPEDSLQLGPEVNGIEIIFQGADSSDAQNFQARFYGYPINGPAEFICDVSGTIGTARGNEDSTTNLYADTLVIDSQQHVKSVAIKDAGGNNRISKLVFDSVGYRDIYCEFPDVTAGINAYARGF